MTRQTARLAAFAIFFVMTAFISLATAQTSLNEWPEPSRVIAEKLGVSVKTIEAHRENMKSKLGVDSHTALVARAAQWLREEERH